MQLRACLKVLPVHSFTFLKRERLLHQFRLIDTSIQESWPHDAAAGDVAVLVKVWMADNHLSQAPLIVLAESMVPAVWESFAQAMQATLAHRPAHNRRADLRKLIVLP